MPAMQTSPEPRWTPDFTALRERAFNLRWATVEPDVIPLTAADPDLPVAREVTDAIARYVAKPHLSYGPPLGLPAFRDAVARHFVREKRAAVDAARVVATNSAASALDLVAQHVICDGDEVVVQDPVDFLVAETARRAGAVLRQWMPDGGRFTLDGLRAAVTPRTRAIVVCHPHNPMGTLWLPDEVQAIGAFAAERGLALVSDEVWSDVVLDGAPFASFAAVEGAWVVYGLSKGYALAGLRIGAVIAPSEAEAQRFGREQGFEHTIEGAATLSQVAAAAALDGAREWRLRFLRHCASQRTLARARLARLEGVRLDEPASATFVLLVDARGVIGRSDEASLAASIERHARVRVVPGSPRWFGDGAAGHIRLSLATTTEILSEALDRIERAWPAILGEMRAHGAASSGDHGAKSTM